MKVSEEIKRLALRNGDLSAFAKSAGEGLDSSQKGVTKREYFAAAALRGLLGRDEPSATYYAAKAARAVKFADALLYALAEPQVEPGEPDKPDEDPKPGKPERLSRPYRHFPGCDCPDCRGDRAMEVRRP